MGFATKISLLALISLVKGDGLTLGSEKGRKIFDEDTTANPAIWRQANNVTIHAGDNDVISGITITDLREDKKGEAVVVDGGIGEKNITVELKSPTALRGYEFHIQAYAVSETEADTIKEQNHQNGNANKAVDPTKPYYPSNPRIAANDGNTTPLNSQPSKATTLADLEKTETKRSADVSTPKTVPANNASSTSKYPSTKAQDIQQNKALGNPEKTETKRSADDSSKGTTEKTYTTSTPKYHTTPMKAYIPFAHIDDRNKEITPSAIPKDGLHQDADSTGIKTARSVPEEMVPFKDAKTLKDESSTIKPEGPVPVPELIMKNRDSAKTNEQSEEAIVLSDPIEVKITSSTKESSNQGDNLSPTTKVYTQKPLTSVQ